MHLLYLMISISNLGVKDNPISDHLIHMDLNNQAKPCILWRGISTEYLSVQTRNRLLLGCDSKNCCILSSLASCERAAWYGSTVSLVPLRSWRLSAFSTSLHVSICRQKKDVAVNSQAWSYHVSNSSFAKCMYKNSYTSKRMCIITKITANTFKTILEMKAYLVTEDYCFWDRPLIH